ncbi:MAG: DUF2281 domain-containing protein [Candidatus Hydrogenedens sp.]|nr:DUF2281 domain-containing protein [Candidatus Hydrogenedens sp.]
MKDISLNDLPPDVRRDALLYIEFLMSRRQAESPKPAPTFSWAGGLEELRDKYTSVELQQKAREWF